ncbi:hypothetical protein D3C85_908070 [compost metagenome]
MRHCQLAHAFDECTLGAAGGIGAHQAFFDLAVGLAHNGLGHLVFAVELRGLLQRLVHRVDRDGRLTVAVDVQFGRRQAVDPLHDHQATCQVHRYIDGGRGQHVVVIVDVQADAMFGAEADGNRLTDSGAFLYLAQRAIAVVGNLDTGGIGAELLGLGLHIGLHRQQNVVELPGTGIEGTAGLFEQATAGVGEKHLAAVGTVDIRRNALHLAKNRQRITPGRRCRYAVARATGVEELLGAIEPPDGYLLGRGKGEQAVHVFENGMAHHLDCLGAILLAGAGEIVECAVPGNVKVGFPLVIEQRTGNGRGRGVVRHLQTHGGGGVARFEAVIQRLVDQGVVATDMAQGVDPVKLVRCPTAKATGVVRKLQVHRHGMAFPGLAAAHSRRVGVDVKARDKLL